MPDFIIVFDDPDGIDTAKIESALQNRPGVEELPVRSWKFPWGTVSVQQSRCYGYEPLLRQGELYFSVGRPRVMGVEHEAKGPSGMMEEVSRLAKSQAQDLDFENLTGVFVLGACSPREVTLFTDRMGVYPVYHAASKSGGNHILGTQPEIVAELSGRKFDYDEVSLAEILIKSSITFPFTTRVGMEELPPGSKISINKGSSGQSLLATTQLWLPREPKSWQSLQDSVDQLEYALKYSGEDLTRGSVRVASTLSGGADSRVVLSCIPTGKRVAAITYGDHVNRESEIAKSIAEAIGIDHHLIIRPPEMYAEIPALEGQLLGYERGPGHSHGYALRMSNLKVDFDLLLCGDRADTLIKGLFTPQRLLGFYHNQFNVSWCRKNWNSPYVMVTKGISATQGLVRSEIVEAIYERVYARIQALKRFRPRTAVEWFNFYPLSRREPISYTNSLTRLYPHDLPFVHSKVLDVAVSADPYHKFTKALSVGAFNRLAGCINNLPDANDGLPSSASVSRKKIAKLRKRFRRIFERPDKFDSVTQSGSCPWFTDDSWVDYRLLQKYSPKWQEYRSKSWPGSSTVNKLFRVPPHDILQKYNDKLPVYFQYNLIHLSNSVR